MAGLIYQVKAMRNEIQELRDERKASWTISDQLLFAARWKAENPAHIVPDVRLIVHTMDTANANIPKKTTP